MARLLWSSLLATGCLLVAGQQRRRERRPVERLLVAGTSTRPLFSARDEEQPLVGKGFMPDFGWSGPEWNEGSEWGFKESKRVVTERSEALFEGREYVEQPDVEAREYVEPVRRSRPRWRIEGEAGGQKAQRRSDMGRRRRPSKASRIQGEVYRRPEGEVNYRPKNQPEEDTYRPRKPGWGRTRIRQEEFAPPSRVEVVRPVGLSRTSVKVTEEQEEYSESQHPGSISLGLFGDTGNRGQATKPPRSLVQTSEKFLPDDLTGLRTKELRELKEQLEGAQGEGFQRAKNLAGAVPGWNPRKPGERAQFQPTREFKLRPLLEKTKIRPQRWRPQTERSLIGSPFFQLEYDDDEEEVKPLNQATESGDWSLTPEHSWSLDQDTERDPDIEGFTPSSADLTSSKELAILPDPVPDTSSKSSSFFLPTLNPYEEYTAAAFRPTEPSVATDDSPTQPADSSPRPPATKLDLFKPKWDSINRTPATSMDTQESKWKYEGGRPLATTQRPDLWTSSYVARARDSERNADRAFHAKKEEKEQEEEVEVVETKKDAEQNDKITANDMESDGLEEGEEREIVIDREFLEGRRRVSTQSPFLRGPRPATSRRENEAEPRSSEEPEILKDNELPSELTNLSEENAYSKTHIRKQKTVPRKSTPPPVVVTEDNTELNDENRIQDNLDLPRGVQDNNDRYAKSHIRLMKPKESGNRDYSKLTFKDIRAKIPVPKLKKLLSKHGFSVSDIFSKNVKALEIVDRAMRSKSYLKEEDENQISIPWPTTTIDLKPDRKFEEEDKREDSPRRIDWKNDKKPNRKSEVEDVPRRKDRKSEKSKPKKASIDIDAEIEAEAAEMDLKSLMKKISPMSLSEVLQEVSETKNWKDLIVFPQLQVGFTLPDVMAGNREAIKKVLRYHRQVTQPEPILESPKKMEDTEEEGDLDEDDPFKDLDIEIKMWSPPSVEEDVAKVREKPDVDEEAASSTKKPFVPSRKKNGLSSVDLFKKFRKFNKTPRTPSFSTTAKPTTPSGNLVRSTTLMFGDRTTQKTKEKFLPTQFSVKPSKARENPIVKTRQRVLNRFGFDPREKNEEATEATENAEELVTTTPYDASLNITLTNLNMTASDVIDKANLTVPGIDTLFKGITKEKAEVIYGEKKEPPKRKKEARPQRKQTYINTDFGGGGARFRNSWGGGGSSWGGGGRIVTNRRTSTTTRAPMTYFGLNEPIGESSSTNLDIDNHDLLNGDYEGVVDYDYYPYDYEPNEVPTGVKSALIASSVVGGLAVSIFLCIFMLCLWKQMKSKLRMAGEYEDRSQGFLSSVFFKKSKKDIKKETAGYFNKVSPIGEQHYSTTSSEEY